MKHCVEYTSHGEGLLDPDRYIKYPYVCDRCNDTCSGITKIGGYSVCLECNREIRSGVLKVDFAEASGAEFFEWMRNEAENHEAHVIEPLEWFILEASQNFLDWAVTGEWSGNYNGKR